MNYKSSIVLFLFLLAGRSLSGQSPEKFYVHLDKPFYLAGDDIWYKVYLLNEDTTRLQSNVIHLQLFGPDGELITHQKLRRNKNFAFGKIALPPAQEAGPYLLRCYTHWNRNFSKGYDWQKTIAVYKTGKSNKATGSQAVANTEIAAFDQKNTLRFEIEPLKKTVKKREQVEITIQSVTAEGRPAAANLSMAVIDLNWLPENLFTGEALIERAASLNNLPKVPVASNLITPEKNLEISGVLYDPESGQLLSTNFLSLHQITPRGFYPSKSSKGTFNITLPDYYGSKTFQLHNLNPFLSLTPRIELNPLPPADASEGPFTTPDSAVFRYLLLATAYQNVRSVFQKQTSGNTPATDLKTFRPAPFSNPDKSYDISRFENLDDIGEFIKEIILTASVTQKNGQWAVKLYNPRNKQHFPYPPWYFMDGYLVVDEAQVLGTSLKEIERIDIFLKRNSIAGNISRMMAGNGVIAIYSKAGNLALRQKEKLNLIQFPGYEVPPVFRVIEPVGSKDQPNFDPIVYWNPNIQTDQNGRARLSFRSSDAIGKFLIYAEGISGNGTPGFGKTFFQVQF